MLSVHVTVQAHIGRAKHRRQRTGHLSSNHLPFSFEKDEEGELMILTSSVFSDES